MLAFLVHADAPGLAIFSKRLLGFLQDFIGLDLSWTDKQNGANLDLQFSIDSAIAHDALIMGWGWCLADDAGNKDTRLDIRFADGSKQVIVCISNRSRDDVAQAFPDNPNAISAGFIFLSKLDSASDIVSTTLSVSLRNGRVETRPLPGFPDKFSPDSMSAGVVLNRFQKAWRLVRLGRTRYVLGRAWGEAKRFIRRQINGAPTTGLVQKKIELVFDHQLGGGANRYRDEKIDRIVRAGGMAALLVFDLPRLQYRLEFHRPGGKQIEFLDNFEAMRHRLSQMRYATIHVNNLVSYPDPLVMVRLIARLKHECDCELLAYLHDFHAVCPSYTLLNAQGRYCGVPDAEVCKKCLPSNKLTFPAFSRQSDIAPWRETWREMLGSATKIVAFSQSTVDIFRLAFPEQDKLPQIMVQPHTIQLSRYPKCTPQLRGPLKVAVIGHIGFAKGAVIVQEVVRLIEQRALPVQIVVIGTLERDAAFPHVVTTGPFESASLPALLKEHGIGVCLLPSICPETFSYVTEEVITMEMPIVCFDLGAPASKVRHYRYGQVSEEISAQGALDAIMSLVNRLELVAA